ncbi:MAG: acetyl-CoA carboxylase biotin carboxylase subunit family protein [Gemmatimonadaceae bacterium]
MPFVIFVAPFFSDPASRTMAAIAGLPGVRLGVIGRQAQEEAPDYLRGRLTAHWRVDDVLDPGQLVWAARGLSSLVGEPIARMWGSLEQAQVPIAEAREQLGIAGMSAETTRAFRDKSKMKDILRAAGVPCARHALVRSLDEGRAAAQRIGFPLVVKPPDGAGSVGTFRVENEDQLLVALSASTPSAEHPVLLEEFIVGSEHSLETISIDGEAVWHSLTHYRPTPLEVVRNQWIQWCVLLPREVDDPAYDDIKRAAADGLAALGMQSGLTHLEWFRRQDGSVAIGEVGARPPGAQITTMVSRANDFDFLQEWARTIIYGEFRQPVRQFAVGTAFLRGQGSGTVRAVHGLETVQRLFGHLVCDHRLPYIGMGRTGSYEGEGFIIIRHPETAVVSDALEQIVSLIHVELG